MTKKIIIISILAIIAIGGGVVYYLWNKPKTNAADVKPNYVLPADSLGSAFAKDEEAANAKYVKDSVALEIQGTVDSEVLSH
jgi:signal transduction histidine kinase